MSVLEERPTVEVVPSLDELAATINSEHKACEESISQGVTHALRAGQAILKARATVPRGQWGTWCDEHLKLNHTAISTFTRMATYADIVGEAPNMLAARKLILGLPGTRPSGYPAVIPIEDAKKLYESGWSYERIGKHLGFSTMGIWSALNPEDARRHRKNGQSKTTLKKRENRRVARAEAAERTGGGINATFKSIRRAQIDANNLSETGSTPEIRQAATLAYRAMGRAEDEIAKILVLA